MATTNVTQPALSLWRVSGAFCIIAIAALLGNVAPSLPYVFSHLNDMSALLNFPPGIILATQFGMDGAVIVAVLATLRWSLRRSLRDLGFTSPSGKTILYAIGTGVVMFVLVNGLGTLINTLAHQTHEQVALKIFGTTRDPWLRAQFALYVALIGPIAEELGFRVFLFSAMRDFWGVSIGVIVSSAVFALAHLDLYAAIPLFAGGLLLCVLYQRTRNAWASMIAHGLFNASSLAVLWLLPHAGI